jgi:hypothetical protein
MSMIEMFGVDEASGVRQGMRGRELDEYEYEDE